MGLNSTPSAERVHIAFFGLRNAGKSSLVNKLTNQNVSLVSDIKGTTTDPVFKAMELLPLGPVMIIDTPGIDDEGELGLLRVERTKDILTKTDIAVLVTDCKRDLHELEADLIKTFLEKNIKFIIAKNKCDLLQKIPKTKETEIHVSAKTGYGIEALKKLLGEFALSSKAQQPLISDLINEGDLVVLVTPIDESAPKGRLILPQQQTIREILDCGATAIVTKDTDLTKMLKSLSQKPALVITDSQVFGEVNSSLPADIPLTSFSILFARYKGNLKTAVTGAAELSRLKDGDTVLISEGCTHHRQCGDIGTVKLPNWIRKFTGKNLSFEFTSGNEFPKELSKYSLIIHCGGCMLNEKEMKSRLERANMNSVPITNYGITIAHINGILKRSTAIFPDIKEIL